MASNGQHEEESNPLEGQKVFRIKRSAFVIGSVGLVISVGVACIAFISWPTTSAALILTALFAYLAIPIFISYLVTRLYVDMEGIEHRNGLGIRKRIKWCDVKAVCFLANGTLVVCGERDKIKIEPLYRNAENLGALIDKYCPHIFSAKAAAVVAGPGVQSEDGVITFRRKRYIAVIGILMMAIGIGFLLTPAAWLAKWLILIMYGIPGLLIFLSFAVPRAYADDEKITYRNLAGGKKQIRWEDIRSVRSVIRAGLYIKSHNQRIKVGVGFAGYDLLCAIVAESRKSARSGE